MSVMLGVCVVTTWLQRSQQIGLSIYNTHDELGVIGHSKKNTCPLLNIDDIYIGVNM